MGNNIYAATASDGCDSTPWRGQVYKIDVSATPTVTGTFVVVPGIAAPMGAAEFGGMAASRQISLPEMFTLRPAMTRTCLQKATRHLPIA